MPTMLDCQSFRFNHCHLDFRHVTECQDKCFFYKSKFIRLLCQCEGDRSVGISGDDTEVLIERRFIESEYGEPQEQRDWIKGQFRELFKEIFDDESTGCMFEDECWNCGKLKTECKCPKEVTD